MTWSSLDFCYCVSLLNRCVLCDFQGYCAILRSGDFGLHGIYQSALESTSAVDGIVTLLTFSTTSIPWPALIEAPFFTFNSVTLPSAGAFSTVRVIILTYVDEITREVIFAKLNYMLDLLLLFGNSRARRAMNRYYR